MVLTTSMLTQIRSDIKDDLELLMLHGAFGTDNTTPTAGDTELGSETFRDAIDEWDESAADKITASLVVETTEGNGQSVAEAGWFNSAKVEVDNCDALSGFSDSADMTTSLNTSTYYEGTGAIDLTKDGGGSDTASTEDTVTSRNFTSKTLRVSLYIVDSTALAKLAASGAVVIRYGSDSSNYYQWSIDAADLSEGWNHLNAMTSGTAVVTGSPVITACDYFKIALKATGAAVTWSAGDFIMDDVSLYGGTMYTRNVLTAITKTNDISLYLDTSITITVEEV